jgi:hypothetical protein
LLKLEEIFEEGASMEQLEVVSLGESSVEIQPLSASHTLELINSCAVYSDKPQL